jgi:hypothetical protein
MARRLPAFAALVTAFVATVSAGTSAEAPGAFAPLSTLGHLRPAPYPGDPGPELVPIPAARVLAPPASTARAGKPVDGIRCEFNARVVFHVHIHLTLFVDGKQRALPAGIGIWPPLGPQNYRNGQFGITRGNCFSWLSTHYRDGIIHTEAPVRRTFLLGQFFDLWGQPLSRSRVGPARGQVTVIVGRRVWTGDPRRVPLAAHAQIQLEVGSPLVAPETIEFPGGF